MLPAGFQMPAALILIVAGLLSCFAGYRFFRIVLGIVGFVLGALLVSSAMGAEQRFWMLAGGFIGGVIGALIMIAAYFVGVALLGAGVGVLVAHAIWAALGREPHLFIVVLLAVVGALGAMSLQRYVIIVTTAFGGAQTAAVGVSAMLGSRLAAEAAARSVFLVYPLDPVPGTAWDIAAAAVLGFIGLIVQLKVRAK